MAASCRAFRITMLAIVVRGAAPGGSIPKKALVLYRYKCMSESAAETTSGAFPCNGVEADYRAIFDAVPDLYLLVTRDLTIVTANQAYCRATMTDVAAIAGKKLF